MSQNAQEELTSPSQNVSVTAGNSEPARLSRAAPRSTVQGAIAAKRILADDSKGNLLSLDQLILILEKQAELTHSGDLRHLETMLTTQAQTLDLLFNRLLREGLAELREWLDVSDKYMKLAFRAQAQCRATAATLHDMKHPRPMALVAQQANIAHGPQQVNNGSSPTETSSHSTNPAPTPNELLEHSADGQRLDPGASGTAAPSDHDVETVEVLHGAANA